MKFYISKTLGNPFWSGWGGILFATKLDNSALSHDKHYSLGEIYKEMRKNLKPKGLFFFFF